MKKMLSFLLILSFAATLLLPVNIYAEEAILIFSYSFEEDSMTYNPDGKAIIARDNECSILRHTDMEKAYFGCHTDITIPYDELGEITANCADGKKIAIIRDGRFVLPGTELLNEALEK